MAAIEPLAAAPSGKAILDTARQHIGEKYVFGVPVPKNHADWKGPWDCAEFVSWVVFQVSGILYGCDNDAGSPATADAFTGYWQRDANTLGQLISVEQAARMAGAAVLRAPQAKATGHIVVSDGTGGTVEAQSSKVGVVASTLAGRRWDVGILVPGITYTQGTAVIVPPPSTVVYRLTTPMMKGDKVREMQQRLKAADCSPGAIDGIYGPHTQAAVVAFQRMHGLVGDGEVGPQTAAALGIQLEAA